MAMVDANLYEFLKSHECKLFLRKGEVIAVVLVDFDDIKDFQDIFGQDSFNEGNVEVTLMYGYVGIELNDFIEGTGSEIVDYKSCFDPSDVKEYLLAGDKS
jgi:hypothetical protein